MVVMCCRAIILHHLCFKTFVKCSFLPPIHPSLLEPSILNIQLNFLLTDNLHS